MIAAVTRADFGIAVDPCRHHLRFGISRARPGTPSGLGDSTGPEVFGRAASRCLKSFRRRLSYALLPLIEDAFVCSRPTGHGRGFAAPGGVGAFAATELDPLSDICPGFPSGFDCPREAQSTN